jgi:preprotein translocase subunit SecE
MNTSSVQTIYSNADKLRIGLSALVVMIAIAAFYYLSAQPLWVRVILLLVLLVGAAALYAWTESGKRLFAYGRDAVTEVKKVVWPTRQEALQMTGYVFAFVVVMALMLWLTDKTLEWLLYSVILGWAR